MGDTQTFIEKLYAASERHRLQNPRDMSWPALLSTGEVLEALRKNHAAMSRNDSIYWQAELTILGLLDTLQMVAACASASGHDDDVCIHEIQRLVEAAVK